MISFPGSARTILITVDLEDWFQVENVRAIYPIPRWDSCDLRVDLYTNILLDLFDYYKLRATFFVLGWIAERRQRLVREIEARGHEIASHGYLHQLSYQLSRNELREDLYRSKALLEDITAGQILGYRAPSFSITRRILELLREIGYLYDSSHNNIGFNKRYGKIKNEWLRSEAGHMMADNGILELPVSNLRMGKFVLPWGGGGYFRFWPFFLFKRGVNRILRDRDYVFYFHPWELDSVQPRIRNIDPISRFRHYRNLPHTFHRLNNFLSTFRSYTFTSCRSYLFDRPALSLTATNDSQSEGERART